MSRYRREKHCPRCGKTFINKGSYIQHLEKEVNDYSNIYMVLLDHKENIDQLKEKVNELKCSKNNHGEKEMK